MKRAVSSRRPASHRFGAAPDGYTLFSSATVGASYGFYCENRFHLNRNASSRRRRPLQADCSRCEYRAA